MDCRVPGSSVHGILQARILEWVAMSHPNLGPLCSQDFKNQMPLKISFSSSLIPGSWYSIPMDDWWTWPITGCLYRWEMEGEGQGCEDECSMDAGSSEHTSWLVGYDQPAHTYVDPAPAFSPTSWLWWWKSCSLYPSPGTQGWVTRRGEGFLPPSWCIELSLQSHSRLLSHNTLKHCVPPNVTCGATVFTKLQAIRGPWLLYSWHK